MRSNVCASAFLGLVLLSGHGRAQEAPSSAALDLRLEIGKASVVLGEPVYATVRLVNVGATPVEASKLLDPQTGNVQIDVAGPNKPRFVFLPLFYADAVRARMSLASGEEVAAAFPIFYGSLGWTFDRPGTYRVTAVYRNRSGTQNEVLRSNSADVTVADESGVGARLMSGTSVGEEAAKFLLWQRGDHLRAGQELLTDLLKKNPNSPVADYALLAFGRNLSRGFRNYAVGQARQPDCAVAVKYFQQVRSDRLPVFLRIQQQLDEARCRIRMSHPAQAGEALTRAEQMGGGRAEFRLLFQQALRLEPALKQAP